ncbi:MAG: hypothetical protein Kow00124_18240 [Anaerolineae bacterium]
MLQDVNVEQVDRLDDFSQIEEVQRRTWGMTETEVMPVHALAAAHHHGGMVLAAYTPERRIVGFLLGLVGCRDEYAPLMGTPYYHQSFMMGVLPEFQGQGVGTALKLEQRRIALSQGYALAVWTYDPLLLPNAALNIGRLATICRRYVRDAYGELSGINAGLNTDRFEVEWWLCSRRVERRLGNPEKKIPPQPHPAPSAFRRAGVPLINAALMRTDGLPGPCDSFSLPRGEPRIQVEIPYDYHALRDADRGLARAWRDHARALFEAAFAGGYVVKYFGAEGGRAFYTLSTEADIMALARGYDQG